MIDSIDQLEDMLSAPPPGVIETFQKLDGDLIVLGVAGKMGPTLARMALRAADAAGKRRGASSASLASPIPRQRPNCGGMESKSFGPICSTRSCRVVAAA